MEIQENISLRDFNTYKTGGLARYFAMPETADELINLITWSVAKNIPHELIGYGANILVSDSGYDGLIICLRNFEKWIVAKGDKIMAGAGALLNDAVKYACDSGLGGMENMAGIPGTIGGAARMNAGAFGTEMKDVVSRINVIESVSKTAFELKHRVMDAAEAEFGYRKAPGLDEKIVTAVEFTLTPGDAAALETARKAVIKKRVEKQPLNFPSCGSVFKRPLEGYAGAYIESCGLKGLRFGGAVISEKHANFILNDSNATSMDIFLLIQQIKQLVYRECGVPLEEEVKYIGKFEII